MCAGGACQSGGGRSLRHPPYDMHITSIALVTLNQESSLP